MASLSDQLGAKLPRYYFTVKRCQQPRSELLQKGRLFSESFSLA